MRVLKKGTGQRGWSVEAECTGANNGGGGCSAKLLVEQDDLYKTYSSDRPGYQMHITFRCPECGVETDVPDNKVPGHVVSKLVDKKDRHPTDRDPL
jgi:hypothetical protein